MLQTIRDYTQGWIAGVILTLIIFSFALWGIHSYFVGGGGNVNVAEVNGVEISKEQLAVTYERLRRQAQAQIGSSPIKSTDEADLRKHALQGLIELEVLKQAALSEGFRVSDHQTDNYLQSMPEFQVNGQFSIERLQEVLSSTLLSTSEFIDIVRNSLLIEQPKLGIVFTSFSLPDETAYNIALVNQEREIDYINLPISSFLAKPITISPEAIAAYYKKHKDDFMTPEQVNIDYVELSLNDLAAKLAPTDSMLKSFYDENINSYTQPLRWKYSSLELPIPTNATAEEITNSKNNADLAVEALKKGKDIKTIANQYKAILINHDWTPLSQVQEELQKTISQLIKPGDISAPLQTNKGFVILKITALDEPKIQSFETVKNAVKQAYVRQHAEEKLAELREQMADSAYEHPESLEYTSKTFNLPIKTSELFTREKGVNDISQNKKIRDAAFSNDVLNLKNNSDVITINPETLVILRVKSHIAAALLPLTSVSKQIDAKLRTEEAEKNAGQMATDLKTKLDAGENPEQLASANHLTWNKTGLIGRYSTKVDSAILDLAFRLPHPKAANKPVYGITRVPNGYAIVALKSAKKGTIADKKQVDIFAEQIQTSDGFLEYELYKQSLLKNAKVSVTERP